MFVRFKKRPLSSSFSRTTTGNYSIRLLIVESFRENGKPRQRVIKYLGAIQLRQMRSPEQKHRFVEAMKRKIDLMDELTFKEQTAVKLSLVRTVFRFH